VKGARAAVVAVPARDEAATVTRCLAAVVTACRRAPVPCVVALAADSCTDDTAARARAVLGAAERTGGTAGAGPGLRGVVVEGRFGTAGAARAAAVEAGLAELGGAVPADRAWVLSTDADTVVGPSWVARHLRWSHHADGVAGLVDVDWEEAAAALAAGARAGAPPGAGELRARFQGSVRAGGTGPGHRHVHGANLGVRASWWQAADGCGPLATGEDHELWHRLRRLGAVLLGVTDLPVVTSGRLLARAPAGFAAHLAALAGP
jgi:hypothetical protein